MYEIYHYGMPRRSGRYPYGSGNRPYQSVERKDIKRAVKGKGRGILIKDHVVPANTIMYRTTSKQEGDLGDKNVYVSYQGPDRDLYRGGHIKYRDRAKSVYEYKFTANKDLKIAGEDSIKSAFGKSLKRDPKLLKESVNAYLNMRIPEGSLSRWYIEYDNNGKLIKNAWDKFVKNAVEDRKNRSMDEIYGELCLSLGKNEKLRDSASEILRKQGFDGMTDEAGVGGKRIGNVIEGIDPLIIFDPKESLSETSFKKVGKLQESSAKKDYLDWTRKARKNSKDKDW